MRNLLKLIYIIALLVICASGAYARVWYIIPDGSGDAPTIQAGIDSSSAGDTILLADGIFSGEGNRDISYQGKGILVRSESDDPDSCIIDCYTTNPWGARGFVFYNGEDTTAVLKGIGITNGYLNSVSYGAAISIQGSSPIIEKCNFIGNSATSSVGTIAGSGGAIDVDTESVLHISDCYFSENQADIDGGGMVIRGYAVIRNCTFENNMASNGGGISITNSANAKIINSVFNQNETGGSYGNDGGAIFINGSEGIIYNCSFMRNSAAAGAAIRCVNSSILTCMSCLIYKNSYPSSMGGGLSVDHSVAMLTNCTLYNNSTFCCEVYVTDNANVNIQKTIIAFNSMGSAAYCSPEDTTSILLLDCCDIYGNSSGNWTDCIADQYGIKGNISADPLFCDASAYNFYLQEGSPCLPYNNSECGVIGAFSANCAQTDANHDELPEQSILNQNYPNPFNPRTLIAFNIIEPSYVSLKIYDVRGRLVRTLVNEFLEIGFYEKLWDSRNNRGEFVSSGVYYYQIQTDNLSDTKKMVMIR